MERVLALCLAAIVGLTIAAPGARAGLLNGASGAETSGTVNVSEDLTPFFPDKVTADIEYAVFAPGGFSTFLSDNGIGFVDPSPAGSRVYAYQVFVTALGDLGQGANLVNQLNVGVDVVDSQVGPGGGPAYIPEALLPGIQEDPTSAAYPGSSVRWQFDNGGGTIGVGESSTIVFYWSPFTYEGGNATVKAGIAGATGTVPVPVPEPGSIGLLVLGGALMIRSRRRGW